MDNIITDFSGINIDFTGVCHSDTLIYNKILNNFSQTKIPFIPGDDLNKPNFIILNIGDQLSRGIYTSVDLENSFDLSNERIFSWNNGEWVIADLTKETFGTNKTNNNQLVAFHFARRLIEAYDNIRPGIIHFSVDNTSVVDWGSATTINTLNNNLNNSLSILGDNYKKINVILFSQGINNQFVTDYKSNLLNLITNLRGLEYTNFRTPFITFELVGDGIWSNINSSLSYLNRNSDIYSRCVLSINLGSYYFDEDNSNEDYKKYYSSETIRKLGTKAFKEYRNMFKSS